MTNAERLAEAIEDMAVRYAEAYSQYINSMRYEDQYYVMQAQRYRAVCRRMMALRRLIESATRQLSRLAG